MTNAARHIRFLLVEDEPSHAELVRMSLEGNDGDDIVHVVDHATDGEQALAYLWREGVYANAPRPDVVLLDLKLPRIDGHEVLARMKSDRSLRTIPVVVLTTSASESDRARAYEDHANSFLTKPVDFDKLKRMISDMKIYWSLWNQSPGAESSVRGAA